MHGNLESKRSGLGYTSREKSVMSWKYIPGALTGRGALKMLLPTVLDEKCT